MDGKVLAQFPAKIQAGVGLVAEVVTPDHLAPEWSLSAVLRGPAAIDISATGDGETHAFGVSPAVTATWAAGTYAAAVRATDGVDVIEIEAGEVEILADLAAITGTHDARGHARKVLDAIEAVIENRATKDQQSYTIAGRTLQRTPIADLLALRAKYRREVAREKAGRARLVGRAVKVRFE